MSFPTPLQNTALPLPGGKGELPALGFGTLIPDPVMAKRAIKAALRVGFRHIDAAEAYRNEDVVGEALQEAFAEGTLTRGELFVTTKLWNNNHRPERVGPALDASLRRLRLDQVDSYLIHTPFAFQPGDEQYPKGEDGQPLYDDGVSLLDTWRAMERLVDAGKCRFIGLSDVRLDAVKAIYTAARIKPAVVQVECHPYLPEWELLEFCQQHGIVLLAFAPLGHGMEPRVLNDPVIVDIAQREHRTPAQVALAWAVQRGAAILTTSTSLDHIRENFDVSALSEESLARMRHDISTRVRLNKVVDTGLPGFIPRAQGA
ncbi:aldo/keto reductase [Luteibacter yeojuensis]|uniref:Aldo/keto reductase n=1 Tax=Luteibacter yeojuensis TaxID=345309 RepID=A0A7X5QSL2_9GAMM|nr:aldo/keto reductase [Luteibacter yeojuensis]NID14648.1 aldo/keto reductase [Luteibacter yeojuensis]